MNSSVIFRGAVGIALLLGVVWKIMMIPRDYDLPRDFVVGFLQQNHFSVTVDSNFLIDTPLIEARNNSCRLHIARVRTRRIELECDRALLHGKAATFHCLSWPSSTSGSQFCGPPSITIGPGFSMNWDYLGMPRRPSLSGPILLAMPKGYPGSSCEIPG